jgi:hypothetical protein
VHDQLRPLLAVPPHTLHHCTPYSRTPAGATQLREKSMLMTQLLFSLLYVEDMRAQSGIDECAVPLHASQDNKQEQLWIAKH